MVRQTKRIVRDQASSEKCQNDYIDESFVRFMCRICRNVNTNWWILLFKEF